MEDGLAIFLENCVSHEIISFLLTEDVFFSLIIFFSHGTHRIHGNNFIYDKIVNK